MANNRLFKVKRLFLSPLNLLISFIEGIGRYVELMISMFRSFFTWHKYLNLSIDHMYQIGILSIPIVILTSLFSGMVTSVQAAYQFELLFESLSNIDELSGSDEFQTLEFNRLLTAAIDYYEDESVTMDKVETGFSVAVLKDKLDEMTL